jgi:putative FmdB family regulatory protein
LINKEGISEEVLCYKKAVMPIYEYTCSKCRKKIEVIQRMSDEPLKTHKGCGGRLTKEISAAGFQFKGTGWYVTDYAKKSQPESKEAPPESGDGKTETKKAETATTTAESSTEKKAAKPKKS